MSSKATITVQKATNADKGVETIEYNLKSPSLEHTFSTVSTAEPLLVRRQSADHRRYIDSHRTAFNDLNEKLRSLVEVNWISVNRMPILERAPEDRALEFTVDIRLDNISNNLVRFFSTLSKRKDDQVRVFQESLFISLIELPQGTAMFDMSALSTLGKNVEALAGIFKELSVDQHRVSGLLEKFKSTGQNIVTRTEKKGRKGGESGNYGG